jgi:N-acetylmuramate 1-kinase
MNIKGNLMDGGSLAQHINARQAWIKEQLGTTVSLEPVAGGASFRQFFRFKHQGQPYILMDVSADELAACQRYVTVTTQFAGIGLRVPNIYAASVERGWVWMEDFGDERLDKVLSADNADECYQKLTDVLVTLQRAPLDLPVFGREPMVFAMRGFHDWFLLSWMDMQFNKAEQAVLDSLYERLIDQAVNQPQRPMHRDYHCQNVLSLPGGELGIIDFQDAKIGPVTYDLASCLRDCYIDWPESQVAAWMRGHYERLTEDRIIQGVSQDQFTQWFDWMGMERHLKACFTFVRKLLRDKDDHYMQYVPRTLRYVERAAAQYAELKPFHQLLIEKILPHFEGKGRLVCEKP